MVTGLNWFALEPTIGLNIFVDFIHVSTPANHSQM